MIQIGVFFKIILAVSKTALKSKAGIVKSKLPKSIARIKALKDDCKLWHFEDEEALRKRSVVGSSGWLVLSVSGTARCINKIFFRSLTPCPSGPHALKAPHTKLLYEGGAVEEYKINQSVITLPAIFIYRNFLLNAWNSPNRVSSIFRVRVFLPPQSNYSLVLSKSPQKVDTEQPFEEKPEEPRGFPHRRRSITKLRPDLNKAAEDFESPPEKTETAENNQQSMFLTQILRYLDSAAAIMTAVTHTLR
ncbi:uncharacterized protein [Hoplias malabaricus]|uniref:uncharacterized protein n=1 Tax=Hoplias malabaricus TaxID=27720 RepID=UPI003462F0F1